MQHRTDRSRRADLRPVTDRWAFKPLALLLLLPVIAASGAVTAVLLAPPFLGAAIGVRELDRRLQAAGADFTKIPKFPQRTTIYANDGTTQLARVYLDNREIVKLNEISMPARRAVLAIEDSEFYEHGALNFASMLRALSENVRAGEVVQGGSTITQQLVKNTLGLDPADQSFERKFQEAALAMRVEEKYSKNRIFWMYLNQVYLGNNVYGIGTASELYFHKPASELTLREGALLAGMIRAPAYYDPVARPRKSWLRRNDVLNRMIGLGPSWLTPERGERIKATDLGLAKGVGELSLPKPPFLVSYVKDQILEDPNGWYRVLGETPEEREQSLSEGGLDIITTLDPDWQKAAYRAANQPWARTPYHPDKKPTADVGIVSIETKTGAIKAMLSGKHYKRDEVDTVTTAHQPGSAFKPYVLAAAFENGIAPTSTYSGVQGTIADERCTTNGKPWVVYNAEGVSRGNLDLYTATAQSVNAVFARLILDAGLQNTADVARRMGVQSPLPPVCSLATGSVGVSPLDQASGFQTLANGGVHCKPYAVAEIRRDDEILLRHRPDCAQVITKVIANLITDMLRGVVEGGTASSVFSSGWGPWPLVGKTGTAQDNTNVWFTGYTRQVSTAVWVGSQGQPYDLDEYWGFDVFGGSIAAPIWKAFMLQVMSGMRPLDFPEPKLVKVPSVIGMPFEQAREILRDAKFTVQSEVIGSYLPEGTVAQQSPGGGVITIPGAAVTLGVSNGIPPMVPVPKVYYLTVEKATAILTRASFSVEIVEEETKDEEKVGTVLRQSPKAGTPTEEGSTVTLYVGVAPADKPGNGNGNGNGGGGGGGD